MIKENCAHSEIKENTLKNVHSMFANNYIFICVSSIFLPAYLLAINENGNIY